MKKAHQKEIERISKSIPKEMTDRLMKKEMKYPTLKEIATRALTDPNVSDIDKARYKAILLSGDLDVMIEVVDPKVEKEINDYLDGEFKKARKLGRLPPPQKTPNIYKKAKKTYGTNTKTKNNRA